MEQLDLPGRNRIAIYGINQRIWNGGSSVERRQGANGRNKFRESKFKGQTNGVVNGEDVNEIAQ